MNISRKQFLTGLFGVSVSTTVPFNCVARTISDFEFNKCKNDIIYFIEHYVKLDGKLVKLRKIQKTYFTQLMQHNVFICKKCRQSGITTMNMMYALWRVTFFKNQYVDMVFCDTRQPIVAANNIMTHFNASDLVSAKSNGVEFSETGPVLSFENGNTIRFMSYSRCQNICGEAHPQHIVIADEIAFAEKKNDLKFVNKICEEIVTDKSSDTTIIIMASTPNARHDAFNVFYESCPHMTITIDDCEDYPRLYAASDTLRQILSSQQFNREYLCQI